MKHILAVSAAIFVAVLMAACSAQSNITATAQPAGSATATAVASSTPSPTATLAPTIEPSPTFVGCIPPTPAPTIKPVETVQSCITIEESLPVDLDLEGAIVLSNDQRTLSLYHLDLRSRRKSPFPNAIFNTYDPREYTALSPDHKWLAYFDVARDERGNQKSRILQVTNAEGRYLDMSYWGLNWQKFVGWMDEKHLVLAAEDYPGGEYLVLNPFTAEFKTLDISLKELLPTLEWFSWYHNFDNAVPDPSLSHWVTEVDKGDYHVWQLIKLEEKENLWEGEYRYWDPPLWSPDGQYFVTMGDFSDPSDRSVNWMLLRVDKNGEAIPISNPISGVTPGMSWSPDSRFLASWVGPNPNSDSYYPTQLVLIDVQKPLYMDLCIRKGDTWNQHRPVWSPDGKYLAVAVSRTEAVERYGYAYDKIFWDTVIIDLQESRGYFLEKNAVPLAWMRKP